MKYYISLFWVAILIYFIPTAQAQELNAQVLVKANNLQTADPKMFITLEKDLKEFLNNRKWTDEVYRSEERIECSFLINIIEEVSSTRFKASVTIQSNRPVYNTSYNSTLLNHQDKDWEFDYAEYQPLDFNETAYLSELTSLVAFYVYTIIGIDHDSFSRQGGTPYYNKAQEVVNNAQSSRSKGWKSMDDNKRNNRFWLIENFLNSKYDAARRAYYEYHRQGLDLMSKEQAPGRQGVTNALGYIEALRKNNTNSALLDLFIRTKSDEIASIYADQQVPPQERMTIYNMMVQIDASNASKYNKISSIAAANTPNKNPK